MGRLTEGWAGTFLGFALLLFALMAPTNVASDGTSMIAVSESIVTDLDLSVPCADGIERRDGRCFSTYYPLQSVLAVPFVGAGRALAHVAGLPATFVGRFAALLIPLLAAAAIATLTAYLTAAAGASRRRAHLAGATVVLATEIAVYWRTFFADVLAALVVLVAVAALLDGSPRARRLLGPAAALLVLTKPQFVLVVPALAAVYAWRTGTWTAVRSALIGTVAGAAVYGLYNWARFADVLDLGGEARDIDASSLRPGDLLDALGLLTISPGRGLLVYSPIVIAGLAALWSARRSLLAQLTATAAVSTLAIALTNPGEGQNWGSRYLVVLIPLLTVAAFSSPRLPRWIAPACAALGLAICLPTFVGFYQRYYDEQFAHGREPRALYWSVPRSPLVGVWGSAVRTVDDARHTDVDALVRESEGENRFFRVVAQWWWMTPAGNVPRIVGVLLAALSAAGGLVLLRRRPRR